VAERMPAAVRVISRADSKVASSPAVNKAVNRLANVIR
jgi:hypothetical protein